MWAAAAFLASPGAAVPQRASPSGMYFDATVIHTGAVADLLGELPHGTSLFPVVFAGGKVAFPLESELFELAPAYGRDDALAALVEAATANGNPTYLTLDLLRWSPPRVNPEDDIYTRRPDLYSVERGGECGAAGPGKDAGRWVSPVNPEVRAILRQVAETLAERYPAASGIALSGRLSSRQILGYDVAARLAYIKHARIDPIDIPLYPNTREARRIGNEWWQWRLDQVSETVAEVGAAYTARHPGGAVIAVGDARAYEGSLKSRAGPAEDWLSWLVAGSADSLVLSGSWAARSYDGVYARAVALLAKLERPVLVRPLIGAGRDDRASFAQLEALRAQADVPSVVVRVDRSADLPRAVRLLNELHK